MHIEFSLKALLQELFDQGREYTIGTQQRGTVFELLLRLLFER